MGHQKPTYIGWINGIPSPRHSEHAITGAFDDYVNKTRLAGFRWNDEFDAALAAVAARNSLVKKKYGVQMLVGEQQHAKIKPHL
jgi:hypothetical protein